MSDEHNPAEPTPDSEKFKPKNVANLGQGQPGTEGRQDRNMKNLARGSEGDTRRASQHRS